MKLYQVDAFTNQPFRGNPAGVCLLNSPADPAWMQAVAGEMNLSETAFLYPEGDAYRLRWFTPAAEVELCGHATLASAHILWQSGVLAPDAEACFDTRSGRLKAHRAGEWIVLDFPAKPIEPAEPPASLLNALGIQQYVYCGKNRMDYLLEVESEEMVRNLAPDFGVLKLVPMRGVMVTSQSATGEYDFVARFFAPAVGVNEDPVTGSAHCALAPYWGEKLGKVNLLAYQASARGGVLRVRQQAERVLLEGQAVTVFSAELAASAV